MTNNAREHIHRESRERERGFELDGLEVVRTSEVEVFTEEVSELLRKLSHDDTIIMKDMRTLKTTLEAIRVSTGAETAPLGSFEESEEWKKNAVIWKRIEEWRGGIDYALLNGLTRITPKVAQMMVDKCWGDLHLDEVTSLSSVSARILCTHQRSISLNGLISISDEVAELLGQHAETTKGREYEAGLYLHRLTELSVKAAEGISQHKGPLSLMGLNTLSPNVARALGQHEVGVLTLRWDTDTMSYEAAEKLSDHPGDLEIYLHGLPEELAEKLSKKRGRLSFPWIQEFSKDTAEQLGQHEGTLCLNGMRFLPDDIAVKLSTHRGRVELNKIESLSDKAAYALSKIPGEVHMKRLLHVSKRAANKLAEHGFVILEDRGKAFELIDRAMIKKGTKY